MLKLLLILSLQQLVQSTVKIITPSLQARTPPPYCTEEVCYKSLPSDQDWWFLSHQGVTFASQQTATDVERCHIHCLEKFFKEENTTVPSRGEVDLYSFNSSKPKICAKQCVGNVLGLSAVELCQNYSICNPNNSSIIDEDITVIPGEPTKPSVKYPPINSTELRRYGLLLYSLNNSMFEDSIHGVVWTVKNTKAKSYVSQQILYAFLHEKIDDQKWVGSFNIPTFQCSYGSLAYQLVNSTLATEFSELPASFDDCLTGQLFPEPPSPSPSGIGALVEISNGTRTNPILRVKIRMLNSTDEPFIAAKGLRIRGHDKLKQTTIFREKYCDLLNSSTVLTYERPAETRSIVLQESQVPWDVLWSCYNKVDLQYYSLPKPPPENNIQPRVLTIPFDLKDQGSSNSFYPPRTIRFDTNTSRHISYVVRGNNTERCTIDVQVTFRITISNVSVLFLSQITVNMTNVTGLRQIVLREFTNPATNNTDITISPQKEGLVIIITQRANGVMIVEEKIIKSELLFGSNYFNYVYTVNFNDSVPSNSEPEAVQNITLLHYTVRATQDQVVARFSWASSSTACYPRLKYIVTLSSPLSLGHYREEYSPQNDKGKIYYNLNTTWYQDDYYNITVVAVYGHQKTAPVTLQFTMMFTTGSPNSIVAIAASISVVGGLFLCMCPCIIALVCVLVWCFRRNKQEAIKDVMWVGGDHEGESEFEAFEPLRDMRLEPVQMDEWELPPHEIIMNQKISDGNFGEVYKASIVSVTRHVKPGTQVAVKMLKFGSNESIKGDFLREIAIMKKISDSRSPFVVNLIGCCTLQEPFCLVLEYVAHGDLLTYLRTMRKKVKQENDYCNVTARDDETKKENYETEEDPAVLQEELDNHYWELGDLKPSNLLSFAYQIASGMEYLSSMLVVHRDLACRNILIDKDKMLKIADFGLSREGKMYLSKSTGQMPLRWMAIEAIVDRVFTTKSDVWSYGISLWEICTLGGYPYPTFNNRELLEALQKGYRLPRPTNCNDDIYTIMQECWNEDPKFRPTFADLRSKMDHMLSSTHKENYIHLLVDEMLPYYNLMPAMEKASRESIPSIQSNSVEEECGQMEKIEHTQENNVSSLEEKDLRQTNQYQFMISPQTMDIGLEAMLETSM